MKRKIDEELYQILKAEYLKGKSLSRINKEYNISRKKLSYHLKKDGVIVNKAPRSRYTNEFKEEICNIYLKQDINIKDLAAKLKTDPKMITSVLVENGLYQKRKPYIYNESFFDVIDTEQKSYWLGFLYADAWISDYGQYTCQLSLNTKDRKHVEKFQNIICPEKPIIDSEIKKTNRIYYSSSYKFSNKHIVTQLINKGCVPNKSLILEFPNRDILPDNLVRHFIRGYVDGDGTIASYPKGKSFSLYFGVVGTLNFLSAMQDIFDREIESYTKVKLQQRAKTKALALQKAGKASTFDIMKFLYNDATVYLDRKYNKFLEIKKSIAVKR